MKKLLATTAMAAILAAPIAFAQTSAGTPPAGATAPATPSTSSTNMRTGNTPATTPSTAPAAAPATGQTTAQTAPQTGAAASAGRTSDANSAMMRPNEVRASKWIGSRVYGSDDKSIGTVNDLIIDRDTGQITQVVLSVGGFLGIGNKHVAVRLNELRLSADNRLTSSMTRDQLKAAPSYAYNDDRNNRATGPSTPPGAANTTRPDRNPR